MYGFHIIIAKQMLICFWKEKGDNCIEEENCCDHDGAEPAGRHHDAYGLRSLGERHEKGRRIAIPSGRQIQNYDDLRHAGYW